MSPENSFVTVFFIHQRIISVLASKSLHLSKLLSSLSCLVIVVVPLAITEAGHLFPDADHPSVLFHRMLSIADFKRALYLL